MGILVAGGGYFATDFFSQNEANGQEPEFEPEQPGLPHVEVVHPVKGEVERIVTQPGTVQPYETVQLFAEVSGYLKTQSVDIGSPVKKDEVLATIETPDLVQQVERTAAGVKQALARVK